MDIGDELNARAALTDARKKWEMEINTVTVMQRPNPDEISYIYQWGDNLGNWYSPQFDNAVEAFRYPLTNPLQICGNVNDEQP